MPGHPEDEAKTKDEAFPEKNKIVDDMKEASIARDPFVLKLNIFLE
jgi:hypothetical protein